MASSKRPSSRKPTGPAALASAHRSSKQASPDTARSASSRAEAGFRSRVTSQGQVTLPSALRKALGVRAGVDEIEYVLEGDHLVVHRVVDDSDIGEDPALEGFLDLLERDISERPEHLSRMPRALRGRMRALTADVAVDHDEAIGGPVAI
jgi:antitoxin PrlF